MNSQHGASDGASSSVIRAADRGIVDSPNILGRFHLKHIRNGEVLHDEICYNTITTEGLTHLFTVGLLAGKKHPDAAVTETLETAWYMGLIENDNNGNAMSFSPTLTHASLQTAGSQEFTNYTGNRQDWTGVAAIHSGGRGVTNAATTAIAGATGVQQVTFAISNGVQASVGGIFIASTDAKESVASTERLFAIAPTSTANISVTNNDQILVSYTATIGS